MATKSYWQRFQRERISRRRLLTATGAGAAGLAVVAACGGGGDGGGDEPQVVASPTGAAATPMAVPKRGGRWVSTSDVNVDTFDPHISIAAGPGIFPSIYNVLVRQSAQQPDFIFHDLAEEFEAPEPGGTEWIFTIRQGVKIAPNTLGVPERDLDSEDARVSFERIKGLPEATAAAFVAPWLESHEAPDLQTYIWKTPSPYAWFLLNIGLFTATIPPREMLDLGEDDLKQNAVGGGPYFISAFTEGENHNWDRNVNYYRKDENNNDAPLPYMDGYDVSIIPERATRLAAFASEQAYSYGPENQAEADQLLSQHDIYQGSQDPINTFISFTMNVTKPPWDNPNVRKAAMHAIRRDDYIERVYGGDAQGNGLVHWPTGAYALPEDELEQLQRYDPELSKQLITEAGFDLPLPVKVMFPASSTIEEHDQHLPIWLVQMEEAGFKVEQDAQDFVTWLDNYTNKNYDASLALNQVYETPENPLDFQHSKGPAGSDTFSNGLLDPDVDAAIDASKEITDTEELVDAIHEVQRLIYDKGPTFLPIVSPFSRVLYWNFVKNIPTGLGNTGLLLRPYIWLDL
jgi:ABC-type transport system substrate-binding protein